MIGSQFRMFGFKFVSLLLFLFRPDLVCDHHCLSFKVGFSVLDFKICTLGVLISLFQVFFLLFFCFRSNFCGSSLPISMLYFLYVSEPWFISLGFIKSHSSNDPSSSSDQRHTLSRGDMISAMCMHMGRQA